MNINQRLELIEKGSLAPSVIKDQITATQRDAVSQGYILSFLYSDEMFVYMLFTQIILPTV